MFVLSRNVSVSYRVIATLVATAVVLWAIGVYHRAEAANITDVYDLLTDSDKGVVSNHTLSFVSPTGVTNGQTIVVTFDAAFDTTGVASDDIDIATSTDGTVAANCAAADDYSAVFAVNVLTITLCPGDGAFVSAGGTTTIEIGTNASFGSTGNNQMVNPSPADGNQSYEIDISAGADSGHTRVVILDDIVVTAQVDTTFDFTVNARATSTLVNGETTTKSSSSTTIPFGVLVNAVPQTIAQNLTVSTNAINGFVVTVQESGHLLSSTGADIDNFANGNNAVTPATWSAPSNSISDERTWGHWGVTSSDTTTTRAPADEFGANEWQGVSTTPQVVFSHTGPADGSTNEIGSTTVGYRVQITGLQEAGDDYNTTLTYIATPTF